MRTAYLLAVFRLDGDAPVFLRTEVHSESEPDLGNLLAFEVCRCTGRTFTRAKAQLLANLALNPAHEWALRSFVQR